MHRSTSRSGLVVATLLFLAAGCAGDSNDTDAGQDNGGKKLCRTDANCDFPETCGPDGYCDLIIDPDPENNKATGTFALKMSFWDYSDPGVNIEVTGKLNAKIFFMDYGGVIYLDDNDGHFYMLLEGILSNTLFNQVVVQLPQSLAPGHQAKFGADDGDSIGTLDRVEKDDRGKVQSRRSVAEITDGYINIDEFSETDLEPVTGDLEIFFRPVIDDGT